MAHLGALIPYRLATETYRELVGLSVSASTLEKITTIAGQRLWELEARVAQASIALPAKQASGKPSLAQPDHLCISIDGTMVNTQEGWREVKVVAVSEVAEGKQGTSVELVHHSYRAGLWGAKEFATEQWAEAQRRGVEQAKRLTTVNDGAPWIWGIVMLCYPTALQVVDWWHVVERLWLVANLVLGQGSKATAAWVAARKEELWEGQVAEVIAALRTLEPASEEGRAAVRLLDEYLRTHAERMRYREFHESGAPIGSGTVESACKNLVGSRLKRGGMRWKPERAEGVLSLRCALHGGNWQRAWHSQRRAA